MDADRSRDDELGRAIDLQHVGERDTHEDVREISSISRTGSDRHQPTLAADVPGTLSEKTTNANMHALAIRPRPNGTCRGMSGW